MRLLLASLMAMQIACAPSSTPAATQQPQFAERLDALLQKEMQDVKLAGLAVAVMRNGEVVYSRTLGKADIEGGIDVSADTSFNLASLTKNFTSVGLMRLVEQGKVELDAPIGRYLSGTPEAWSKITVRHLLSHKSGIPDYTKYPSFREVYTKEISREDVLKWAKESSLEFEPGSRAAYSNTGFVVLGHLIAEVSGKPYVDLLREAVFGPAGMKGASLDEPGKRVAGKAKPYELKGDALALAPEVAKGWSFSAGGLNASLNDLIAWDKVVSKRSLLKAESWDAMWKVEAERLEGRPMNYGLGWVVTKVEGQRMVGHFGDKPGYSSLHFHFPETGVSLIVLANRTNSNSFGIAQKIYEAIK
jgi:D-alanyl-D-alanine carboxypeptidase